MTIAGKPSSTLPIGTEREHPETSGYRMECKVSGCVVIIERADDGGFGAWAPDLPGCVATAEDYDMCVAEMREAIRFHLDGMREDGDPYRSPRPAR